MTIREESEMPGGRNGLPAADIPLGKPPWARLTEVLKGPPLIQKTPPTQILGGLMLGHIWSFLKPFPLFRLVVPNLEILMPFHNLGQYLAHFLSQHQQYRP